MHAFPGAQLAEETICGLRRDLNVIGDMIMRRMASKPLKKRRKRGHRRREKNPELCVSAVSEDDCDAKRAVSRPPGRVICQALDFFVTCDQLGAKRRAETQIPSALCDALVVRYIHRVA